MLRLADARIANYITDSGNGKTGREIRISVDYTDQIVVPFKDLFMKEYSEVTDHEDDSFGQAILLPKVNSQVTSQHKLLLR